MPVASRLAYTVASRDAFRGATNECSNFWQGVWITSASQSDGLTAGLCYAVIAGLIIGAGFAAGSWHASRTGSGVSAAELQDLTGQLQNQRDSIETIRQENEDTLDALSIRIAQMNARMIRLDALGRRLTDMADIDDGEFDFDSDPAIGGPEEPMAAGSNVAYRKCSKP